MPDRKTYNKLVRDRIPEIIQENGGDCEVAELDDATYRIELLKKLVEEAVEARESASSEQLLTELADLNEVIDALLKLNGWNRAKLDSCQSARRDTRGGFEKRLLLKWSGDKQR